MLFSEVSVVWAIFILFSSVISLYISAYAFHRFQVLGARALAFFALSVALYSLGYALEINSESSTKILDALKFEVFWASFTAPAFFTFVVQFIRGKRLSKRLLLSLYILPAIIGLFSLTNHHHHYLYVKYWIEQGQYFPIIRYEPGSIYIAQLVFLISVSLAAELMLLLHWKRSQGVVRKQTLLVLIAGVLPTLSAILNPDRNTFHGLDLQPFMFCLSGLLITVALFRYRMLDLRSIAREYAVDAIHDYLLIIDNAFVVIDMNSAGQKAALFKHCNVGQRIPCDHPLLSSLKLGMKANKLHSNNGRLYEFDSGGKYYQYSLMAVQDNLKHVQGYVVLIHDYTKMTNLLLNMEQLAIKDSLTNIYNRRYLFEAANNAIEEAKKNNQTLSVILFDLDNFKQVNDGYGHLVGDRVLKEIANVITTNLASSDVFGRYGGEEFCIVCPQRSEDQALLVAEKMRCAVERIDWSAYGLQHISASFGICSMAQLTNKSIESLLSCADAALYEAKAQGKNRSIIYQPYLSGKEQA